MNIDCKICNWKAKNYQSLMAHVRSAHHIKTKNYYDKYEKKKGEDKCNVCKKPTRYLNVALGYQRYCTKCGCPRTLKEFVRIYGEEGIKKYNDKNKKISKSSKGKINLGSKNGNYKYPAYYVDCPNCNKRIRVIGSTYRKFCSIKCKAEWQSKNALKEDNYFYKYKDKIKEAIRKKYGVDNVMQNTKIKKKNLKSKVKSSKYRRRYSKMATKFFDKLISTLPTHYTYYYGDNETFIWHKHKLYFYDFEIKELKKIIEFNGNYYHANPSIYKRNEIVKLPGKKHFRAKKIWKMDKKKIRVAKRNGYKTKIVWEKDCLDNPNKVIKDCKEFCLGKVS